MHLIFDCETSGLIDFEAGNSSPSQPNLVSLAAILLDKDFKEVSSFYVLIRQPDGFTIPDEAIAKHGITNEACLLLGVRQFHALSIFEEFLHRARFIAAHNIDFDRRIIQIACQREHFALEVKDDATFRCTMKELTSICKLPKKNGKNGYKWPKLEEAYEFVFRQKHEGAHNALNDCKATAKLYRWLHKDRFEVPANLVTCTSTEGQLSTQN